MSSLNNVTKHKLRINNIEEISKLLWNLQEDACDYTFSNLYFFRRPYEHSFFQFNNHMFIEGQTFDGFKYIMPLNRLDEIETATIDTFLSEDYALFPITKRWLYLFPEEKYNVVVDIDESDYVYSLQKMKTMPGRHLHKKRNLIKQYLTLYEHREIDYSCSDQNDALAVLNGWFERTGLSKEETDYDECYEAILLCPDFGWVGKIYYTEGKPSGILFGEALNSKMFVVHFAKALIDYKGIFPYMYSTLAHCLEGQYEYLNFEQDLGQDSLRQAKSSYFQDFMVEKYSITLKK